MLEIYILVLKCSDFNHFNTVHALIFLDFFNRSSNPDVLKLLNQLNGKPNEPINLQNVDPYMYSYDIRKVLEYYEQR